MQVVQNYDQEDVVQLGRNVLSIDAIGKSNLTELKETQKKHELHFAYGGHNKQVLQNENNFKNWKLFLSESKLEYNKALENKPKEIRKTDLRFIKTLGTGGFGKVMLVKHLGTNNFYAAKLMTKSSLVKEKHIQHARNEKNILHGIRFVFTIHLEYFFQDNVYLYYVLPYVAGGDLFTHLSRVTKLNEISARFYSAQMLLALEYLHNLGLIFRDLKPENVLIDNLGYLKLADFGFCKKIDNRTFTFCGTSDYLAPEILKSKGYGKAVDWWTFGVFLYEISSGSTPFYAKSDSKIYSNIIGGKYKMPGYYSQALKDLIKNILQADLSRRYGNLKGGVNDIKSHRWFSGMEWVLLLHRELKSPFVPVINRPEDTSNFGRISEEPFEESDEDLYGEEFANF